MYNPENPADAYLDELLDEQAMRSQERGWPDSWESVWPLQRLVLWAYERQQISKRGVSLSQRIYETVDELSHKLIDEINPLVDEIQEVNAFWMDDRKSAVWTLSVPDSVIGRLNVSWDVEEQRKMAAEEAASDGSHN